MNKTAIKNFAIWARNKLIADIKYKAGLLGITDKAINDPLSQSTQTVQFFDIGTTQPYAITEDQIKQRKKLVEVIQAKAKQSDYKTAYENVVEEVAYTWFNRLIAIRFMEVNDYLPSRIRVLSSVSDKKAEPDLVTHPMEAGLDYSAYEKDRIMQLKHENKLDELFRMLFIKQCNALNANLPELFEKTSDYTELLLNISFTDRDGVIYHLMNDIPEDDFNVAKEGQVEIIGWLYQFYNTQLKDKVFARPKKQKIKKEEIPAATQLFTPDWIVRYMVENSLGRLWVEGHPNEDIKSNWKYYLEEPEQEEAVQKQLEKIREDYQKIKPETIKVMDPCMGSGHILVYAFDVLMQIYESVGYSPRDAAKSIVENNLYGLDIDDRAYQLAYFAVMMKARQYNRRILDGETACHLFAIKESNTVNINHLKFLGEGLSESEKQNALRDLKKLLNQFEDAKEYGSLIHIEPFNGELLQAFVSNSSESGQLTMETIGIEETQTKLLKLLDIGMLLAQKYDVVVTNPPYMGSNGMGEKLTQFVKKLYTYTKSDLFACFIERVLNMSKTKGLISLITMESWMFLASFEKMRSHILGTKSIVNLLHMPYLGKGGTSLGINFGTAVVVIDNLRIPDFKARYQCIRYFETNEYGIPFVFPTVNKRYKKAKTEKFIRIPGIPIAYWVSEKIADLYEQNKVSEFGECKSGIMTGDDEIFLRLWYEVSIENTKLDCNNYNDFKKNSVKWFPMHKGGKVRKWFGNLHYVINLLNEGYDIKNSGKNYRLRNSKYYFRKGITWSNLSSKMFSARIAEKGTLFGSKGPIFFDVRKDNVLYSLALFNSVVFKTLLGNLSQTMDFTNSQLEIQPYLDILDSKKKNKISYYSSMNVEISKNDWNSFETSYDFTSHPLLKSKNKTIVLSYESFKKECYDRFSQLKKNEEELNSIFIEIYDLQDELTPEEEDKDITVYRVFDTKKDILASMKGSKYILTKQDVIKSFILFAVGCMFGRYSLDVEGLAYAGGEWNAENYKTFIPDKDNIIPITDEEYFKDDIVGLFISFVKKVYGEETLEENLDFVADALGKKGNSSREIIRNYFLKDFFSDHCKTYSVTGSGKRPIYWLFDSGKANGFKALIYMHRYDENTIGNLRIDYLHKLQRIYESEIARMQDTIENSSQSREVAAATKRKEKLIKQLQETKQYDEKIAHLALARIDIDLDDGVKVNYEKVQQDTNGKKLNVLAKI